MTRILAKHAAAMNELPKRSWFRFSLADVLGFVTCVCLIMVVHRAIGFGAPTLLAMCCGAFAVMTWRGPVAVPIIAAAVVQVVTAGLFLFAPIGFDHASNWGLGWGDAVGLLVVHAFSLTMGVSIATIHGQWNAIPIQIGIVGVAIILACSGIGHVPL